MSRRKRNHPMQTKMPLVARMLEALDVPSDGVMKERCITVSGDHSASVSGCDGVLVYTQDRIVLRTGKESVTLCGADLRLCAFVKDLVTIHGRIDAVFLTGAEEVER